MFGMSPVKYVSQYHLQKPLKSTQNEVSRALCTGVLCIFQSWVPMPSVRFSQRIPTDYFLYACLLRYYGGP